MSSFVRPARIRVHAIKNLSMQSSRSMPLPLSFVERYLAVKVAAPPPASAAADLHDPAYRYAAPDHGKVINAGRTAADLGDAQGNGFGSDHAFIYSAECLILGARAPLVPHVSHAVPPLIPLSLIPY